MSPTNVLTDMAALKNWITFILVTKCNLTFPKTFCSNSWYVTYPDMNILPFVLIDNIVHTFQLKGVEPPGFSFQIVNTNLDEFSPRARRRSALLTWQHIASLPPSLPVVYCGGFNTQKESTTGRFLLGRSRYHWKCIYLINIFSFSRFIKLIT